MNYLKESKKYEDLYSLLDGLCLGGFLSPSKNKNGVTFLLPTDAKVIKKIEDLAYSDDAVKVEEASDLLRAHIINDVILTGAEWEQKKANIPNALRMKVKVSKGSGKTVSFANGATAKLDEDFKAVGKGADKEQKLAVWLLSGEMEKGSEPAEMVRMDKKGKAEKKMGGDMDQKTHLANVMKAQANFHQHIHACLSGEGALADDIKLAQIYDEHANIQKNPAAQCVESLIYYLCKVSEAGKQKLVDVFPLLSGLPEFDLILLLKSDLLADELDGWLMWKKSLLWFNVKKSYEETRAFIKAEAQKMCDCVNYDKTLCGQLFQYIDEWRVKVQDSNAKSKINVIQQAYAEQLLNKFADKQIFSQKCIDFYMKQSNFKLCLDQLLYLIVRQISLVRKGHDCGEYLKVCCELASLIEKPEMADELLKKHFLSQSRLQNSIAPNEIVNCIESFVLSLPFLRLRQFSTEELINDFGLKITVSLKEKPTCILHVVAAYCDWEYCKDADGKIADHSHEANVLYTANIGAKPGAVSNMNL
jgi:hypothetical protein